MRAVIFGVLFRCQVANTTKTGFESDMIERFSILFSSYGMSHHHRYISPSTRHLLSIWFCVFLFKHSTVVRASVCVLRRRENCKFEAFFAHPIGSRSVSRCECDFVYGLLDGKWSWKCCVIDWKMMSIIVIEDSFECGFVIDSDHSTNLVRFCANSSHRTSH